MCVSLLRHRFLIKKEKKEKKIKQLVEEKKKKLPRGN